MKEKHFVKIYGALRTGTNFIQTLINDNCTDTVCYDNAFGPKHGSPSRNLGSFFRKVKAKNPDRLEYLKEVYKYLKKNSALHCIIIIKSPYSWYDSIERYTARKRGRPFEFERVYNQYNKLYADYINFYNEPSSYGKYYGKVYIVQYEDLLARPERKVATICKHFEIPLKKKFDVPDRVYMTARFTKKRRGYYLKGGTFGLLPETIKKINDIIDWEVVAFYGYERLEK